MSFIRESRLAYRKVQEVKTAKDGKHFVVKYRKKDEPESMGYHHFFIDKQRALDFEKKIKSQGHIVNEVLEKETSDHEIAMARSELEGIADKATATSSMLENMTESGNPLPAWVQSKITNANHYITTVHDYIKYTPQINESFSLEETTFEKIYQMQQDGKSAEDIAKELKLKPDLVKKVLGEEREWVTSPTAKIILEVLSDTQISQLKKEYDPLKGKTITSAQFNQLKNLYNKLHDGDLEKLQKQNIPFVSSGAGSILRVRKAPVKITNVTVPGLKGMAEGAKRYRETSNVGTSKYVVSYHDGIKKHNDGSDFFDIEIFKNKEVKNKFITDLEKKGYRPVRVGEEVEESFKDNIIKKLVKPIKDYNKKKEEPKPVKESHFSVGQHVIYHGPKNPITPIKAQIIGMASPQKGAYYMIKKADGETTYAAPEQMKLQEATFDVRLDVDGAVDTQSANTVAKMLKDKGIMAKVEPSEGDSKAVTIDTSASKDKVLSVLGNIVDEACWTGYKQVGLKKKGKKMVPNCVPEETIREQKRLYIESIVAVKNKAEKSGMPYSILKQVYDRGMAAWKGGHRPGATQVQWALARVNSFITKSSGTWGGADSDLAKKVRGSK
jgi:riboflavin synthase